MSKRSIFASLLALVLLTSCTGGKAEPTVTPTNDLAPIQTGTAQAAQQLLGTEKVEKTASALKTAEAVQTVDAQATLDEQATQQAQATLDYLATRTAKFSAAAERVQSTRAAATAIAQPMSDLAVKLMEEGAVTSTSGMLHEIDDFDESWAQINWYQWWDTGLSPERYIVQTHVHWTSASETANWFSSGCGFVFDADDEDNYFIVFLGLDGYANMARYYHGISSSLARSYYDKLSVPIGEADLTLAVESDFVTLYVNGQKVVHVHDNQIHKGPFGLTLVSGTNKDFGTRCEMNDINLWELDT